ncbi:MAG: hypothetical protein WCR02_03050 [Sphaerochaetaceae bacterium]
MSEMLDRILGDTNIHLASQRMVSNAGGSGIDGVTVQELGEYLKSN